MDGQTEKLLQHCKDVLALNDLGKWTRPAPNLYPHQWLWDSCFIAIGLRHLDVTRAQTEILSLFRGQWKNGMVPNIVYGADARYHDDIWNSHKSADAPKKYKTSGITQPPLLAEAIVKIGEQLNSAEKKKWYKKTYPNLLAFHEWLYRERDPHHEGVVVLVHPWESGLDNNPAWMKELHMVTKPLWVKAVASTGLIKLFDAIRKDTRYLPAEQRANSNDALTLYALAKRLARKKYKTNLVLRHAPLLIEDVVFNSILVRANTHLVAIADEIKQEIPVWLAERIKRAPKSLELFWDGAKSQYFNRNFTTFEPIEEPSIATFLPLYAGTISKKRAAELVALLQSRGYSTRHPVPSVPTNSSSFQASRYWQGPTWINTNWLIHEGLKQYGYKKEAAELRDKSIALVANGEAYEYFNPTTGAPLGARSFSWTAALTTDFIFQ